jgi:fluoride exporter
MSTSFSNSLLVGIGGSLGSIMRYVTALSIDRKLNSVFPFGTFAVNIVGSFVIGFLVAFIAHKNSEQQSTLRLFFGTGFCGGFTTFSAFALENVNLLEQKAISTSMLYIGLTLIAGFLAVIVGMAAARSIS